MPTLWIEIDLTAEGGKLLGLLVTCSYSLLYPEKGLESKLLEMFSQRFPKNIKPIKHHIYFRCSLDASGTFQPECHWTHLSSASAFCCQAIHAFKVGHLSLLFCLFIGLETKVWICLFSFFPFTCSTHFLLHGQKVNSYLHIYSKFTIFNCKNIS